MKYIQYYYIYNDATAYNCYKRDKKGGQGE